MEKKMPTSATKELEKASLREVSDGIVRKPTTKRISLVWSYEMHLKLRDEKPATSREKELD